MSTGDHVGREGIEDHHYQYDLDVQLETLIQFYEDDRQNYWVKRLESDEWSPLAQLRAEANEIAALIRKRAFALQNTGSYSELNGIYSTYHEERDRIEAKFRWTEEQIEAIPAAHRARLLQFLRQARSLIGPHPDSFDDMDKPLRLVWERLCIDDAWYLVGTMRDRTDRIFELERLIYKELGRRPPPESSVRFLSLVSRCFIYGFATECVVMCRSAMETAFREKVTDAHCARAGERLGEHGYTLAQRIRAAFHVKNNLLTVRRELHRAADEVKERGKKAVHYDPDATKDVLGTIRSALRVINALSDL